jgi:5-methylcytosine-specific restriction endonuclease McrA
VSSSLPKKRRLHLATAEYEKLRQEVLRRDGWRCQSCGTLSNLEVHHQEFRSQSGDDSEATSLRFALHVTPPHIAAEEFGAAVVFDQLDLVY